MKDCKKAVKWLGVLFPTFILISLVGCQTTSTIKTGRMSDLVFDKRLDPTSLDDLINIYKREGFKVERTADDSVVKVTYSDSAASAHMPLIYICNKPHNPNRKAQSYLNDSFSYDLLLSGGPKFNFKRQILDANSLIDAGGLSIGSNLPHGIITVCPEYVFDAYTSPKLGGEKILIPSFVAYDHCSFNSSTSTCNLLLIKSSFLASYSRVEAEKAAREYEQEQKIQMASMAAMRAQQEKERLADIERQRVEDEDRHKARAQEHKRLVAWRSRIRVESKTNCGPVIEVKGNLIKVYAPVANYSSEHWLERDTLFPPEYDCSWYNGNYTAPDTN